MRNTILLMACLFIFKISYAQSLHESEIESKTGNEFPKASYTEIEKTLGKGAIVFAEELLKNGHAVDPTGRFKYERPKGNEHHRTGVELNPNSTRTRLFEYKGHSLMLLDPDRNSHLAIIDTWTGYRYLAGCFNRITHEVVFIIIYNHFYEKKRSPIIFDSVEEFGSSKNSGRVKQGLMNAGYIEKPPAPITGNIGADINAVNNNSNNDTTNIKNPVQWESLLSKTFGFNWKVAPGVAIGTDVLSLAGLYFGGKAALNSFSGSSDSTETAGYNRGGSPNGG